MNPDYTLTRGDLVIRKPNHGKPIAAGVVTHTEVIPYTDPPYTSYQVYIAWCTPPPADYSPSYGYCSTNICNLSSKYKIVKA